MFGEDGLGPSVNADDIVAFVQGYTADGVRSDQQAVRTTEIDYDSILNICDKFHRLSKRKLGTWAESIQELGAGAIACHHQRAVDVSHREHVLMLHLIEGGKSVLAHDGIFFGIPGRRLAYV